MALRKKLSSRVTLLRRLVGSGWGADAKTLHIATLSLVYSTAEYCAPFWCRSAHTRLIDSVLNDAMCIVTGCLRPNPTDHLPVLSGIQPAELRRLGATLSLAHRGSLDPDHILYDLLSGSSNTRKVRLRSRLPFVLAAGNRLDNLVVTKFLNIASKTLNQLSLSSDTRHEINVGMKKKLDCLKKASKTDKWKNERPNEKIVKFYKIKV